MKKWRYEVGDSEAKKRRHSSQRSDVGAIALVLLTTAVFSWFSLVVADAAGPVSRVDSTGDWLVASAFVQGLDPHDDLRNLATYYDVPFWEGDDMLDRVAKAPRTPGALLLLAPLALGNPEQARTIMLGLGFAATAATFVLLAKRLRLSNVILLVGLAAAMLSGPALWHYLFATQSPIVMALVALVVVTAINGDRVTTGVALAIAASLKAFPLVLLILLLVERRRKALIAALSGLVALNLVPLLLPNLSLRSAIAAMTETAASWVDLTIGVPGLIARYSPPGYLAVMAVAAALIGIASVPVIRGRISVPMGALGLLTASLLALPVSWPHYLLVLIPMFVLIRHDWSFRSLTGILLAIGVLLLVPMVPIWLHTAGLALILLAVSIQGFSKIHSRSSTFRPATMV